MKKVCCFGELLLRMSPDPEGQWITSNAMPVYIGGSELNVASSLALWQMPVRYFTALPQNNLSDTICNWLSEKRIDMSATCFSGQRIGIYFLTQGTDLKHADVIYDREGSAFATLKKNSLDWDMILKDVDWFHFSAISPGLSQQAYEICLEAVQEAATRNITVSVDLNYRSKLWQYDKDRVAIMKTLVENCEVVMGNIWSAHELLGVPLDLDIHAQNSPSRYLEHASRTAAAIRAAFPACKIVANTFRFEKNKSVNYYAAIDESDSQYVSPVFQAEQIVDKVGSGDCFMGGLIYGLKNKSSLQQVVNFAAAAAFGKLMEKGDSTTNSAEAIISILNNYGQ